MLDDTERQKVSFAILLNKRNDLIALAPTDDLDVHVSVCFHDQSLSFRMNKLEAQRMSECLTQIVKAIEGHEDIVKAWKDRRS